MTPAPAFRLPGMLAISLAPLALATTLVAGGGCSLNTAGITDPGSGPIHAGSGGLTPVQTGGGGTIDAGGLTGTGGIAAGAGGSGTGLGGATGSGGTTAGSGGATGTGGAQAGTGGATAGGSGGAGVGGAGIGGAGVGGAGVGGKGMGGSGTGGAGMGGMPGVGGASVAIIGCADGSREAFVDLRMFPSIAGCAGGWSVAGVVSNASNNPACGRAGGNDGARPNGSGCTVEDLCAAGWHVCGGANELDSLNVTCAQARLAPATGPMGAPMFFATRQRGVTGTICNANDNIGTNDVHGCGNFGLVEDPNCAPLDHQLSHVECDSQSPWSCGDANSTTEALLVTKSGPAAGGVLCCH
jgi:hypothetical protein